MTYKEALKNVNHRLLIMHLNKKEYKRPPAIMIETIDFLKTSKYAIEKQIPKKPINVILTDENKPLAKGLYCKECKHAIKPSCYGNAYCCYCGSAIDWSDENAEVH